MECPYEWRNDDSHDQGYDICPHGHCDVLFDHNNETEDKTGDKNSQIPPPGNFLIVLRHVYVVSVVVFASSGTLVRAFNVTAPEQDGVSDESSNLLTELVK